MTGGQASNELTVRDMEIANLVHELKDLHARHANLAQWARYLWPCYYVTLVLCIGFLALGLVQDKMIAVFGSFFFLILLIALGIAWWGRRPIDLVAFDYARHPEPSYARFLEKAIAAREARLAALRDEP